MEVLEQTHCKDFTSEPLGRGAQLGRGREYEKDKNMMEWRTMTFSILGVLIA